MAKKIDLAKAIELRKSGYSYQAIVEALGCSIPWCKKNLRGISATPVQDEIVKEVIRLGSSANGITNGEIKYLITARLPAPAIDGLDQKAIDEVYQARGKEIDELAIKIKESARRGNRHLNHNDRQEKEVIIRPYWLLPECPQDCINTINDMAQFMYETLHELANKFRKLYDLDDSYQNSIVYELSRLSAPANTKLLPQGFMERGNQLAGIAETLTSRNKKEIEIRPLLQTTEHGEDDNNVNPFIKVEHLDQSEKENETFERFMASLVAPSDEDSIPPDYFEIPLDEYFCGMNS